MYKIVYGKRLSQNPMDIEIEMGQIKCHLEEYTDEDVAFKHCQDINNDINLILLYVYETSLGTVLFQNRELSKELATHIEQNVLKIEASFNDLFNFDTALGNSLNDIFKANTDEY